MEVDVPADGAEHVGPLAWLEVRGWAGVNRSGEHDVVVLVDVSGSTAYASGIDVDEDGKLGRASRRREAWRSFNPRYLSSDPDDTVLAAELVATRRLVELLDRGRVRVGLISFHGRARLDAPLGSRPERLAAALQRLDGSFGSGMTDMAAALRLAVEALGSSDDSGERGRSILILSDGYPTAPGSEREAERAALDAARAAADAGIRVSAFALGVGEPRDPDVFASVARLSGGLHVRIEKPGEVIHELPRVDLAALAGVEVENVSASAPGRAIRVFPDGSFDAYAPLVRGENVIRVTARGHRGGLRSLQRRVRFEPRQPRDALEAEAFRVELERFRERLRARSTETDLLRDVLLRAPDDGPRELEVELDERSDPGDPD
jgi:Mg-chelatase subunit ChlD